MPVLLAAVSAAVIATLTLAAGATSALVMPKVLASSTAQPATRLTVVAIGDSIMAGHGLAPAQAWLAILASRDGWSFTNLASDGSGFTIPGDNGDTFGDQASIAETLRPDLIILAGSSNDLGASDGIIESDTMTTMAALHAALPATKIIAVSSIWGGTPAPDQLAVINAAVDSAATAVGGFFLPIGQPLSDRPNLLQIDGVHPTAQGQRVLARAVNRALTLGQITL